jgi:hypothetical protein
MSSALNPTFLTVTALKNAIAGILKADLTPEALATSIAPSLIIINKWSTQIPLMLEGSVPLVNANLIFSIRKDLFIGPLFNQATFGTPLSNLPPPFQEFVTFINKLIDAQRVDKDKVVAKVLPSLIFSHLDLLKPFSISLLIVLTLSSPNPSLMMMNLLRSSPPL